MTSTTRRPYQSLAFAFVALALLAGQGRARESATIEGHVFNKLTGVPAEGSSVEIRGHSNVSPSGPVVLARDHTDGNGFYSLEVSDRDFDFDGYTVWVSCVLAKRKGDEARSVHGQSFLRGLHSGVLRRDVYIEAGRFRRRVLCNSLPIDPNAIPPVLIPLE
jgi:hypothetical protein